MASKNRVQVYKEAYSQYFDYKYKCGSTDCKFGTDNKFGQQVHAQAVKGSVGHHLASSSFPFYRCALGAARPCPFRNMDPTEQQIWGRLCGKSALPIKTQAHNRLGTNAQTAKEQIQKWFVNKSTCDLRTMGSAGKQEELATRGLLATTNVTKHWNIGRLFAMGPTFNWDKGGALHDIEQQEQSVDNWDGNWERSKIEMKRYQKVLPTSKLW